jgi:hypothetical protein
MAVMWLIAAFRREIGRTIRSTLDDPIAARATLGGTLLGPFIGVWLSLIAVQAAQVGIASTLMAMTPVISLPLVHFFYHFQEARNGATTEQALGHLLGLRERREVVVVRQVFAADPLTVGDGHQPFDEVLQFADVARPGITQKCIHDLRVNLPDCLEIEAVELFQEDLDEQRYVLDSLAQRRDLDGEDTQPIVEVATKRFGLDHPVQIDVRRSDDPHIDNDGLFPSNTMEGAVLQHSEQPDLCRGCDGADLVEKDRSLVGDFEPAQLAPVGTGERPLFVTEEFTFE